jgi:OmpA-OmpF porin, OOP family
MKNLVLLSLVLIHICYAKGQQNPHTRIKNWQLKGYAKSAERNGDFYSAIDYYQEYYKRSKPDIKFAKKLAYLHYKSKDYKKARPFFEKLIKQGKSKNPEDYFYFAEILKIGQKYDSALFYFLECRKILSKGKRNVYSFLTNVGIEGCELALKKDTFDNLLSIRPLNNTINKVNLESSPIIFNDSVLIYSSLMLDTIPVVTIGEDSIIPVNKFYTAKLKNKDWIGGYDAPEPFYNFDNQNTSNGVFSLDNQRFYFASAKKNWKNQIISTLFVSHKVRGKWQKPVKLNENINLKNYTSTQPAIGKSYDQNLEVIYFISSRKGGWGGMDIWYIVYDIYNEKYKKPVNAGGLINTAGDEITPYYHKIDSSLYFSSNGLPGFGGFDIFKSKGWLVNWSEPINLGKPLNSSYDDIYFKKYENKNYGFIVSNRDGSLYARNPNCCYDIFEFIDKKLWVDLDSIISFTKEPLLVNASKTIDNELNFVDELNTYKHEKHTEIKEKTIISDIRTDLAWEQRTKKTKEEDDFINLENKPFETDNIILTGNIFFEFNKSNLTRESVNFIDTTIYLILKKYPEIVIEIGAHSDNIGDESYNLNLSRLRAESVVNYLSQKGIDKKRMIPVGYGKSRPRYSPFFPNGKDNPKAREKNRRIEFILVETKKTN